MSETVTTSGSDTPRPRFSPEVIDDPRMRRNLRVLLNSPEFMSLLSPRAREELERYRAAAAVRTRSRRRSGADETPVQGQ